MTKREYKACGREIRTTELLRQLLSILFEYNTVAFILFALAGFYPQLTTAESLDLMALGRTYFLLALVVLVYHFRGLGWALQLARRPRQWFGAINQNTQLLNKMGQKYADGNSIARTTSYMSVFFLGLFILFDVLWFFGLSNK